MAATVSWQANRQGFPDASTFTFTSVPIGTAAADRHVVMGVGGNDNVALYTIFPAVTVGGITATRAGGGVHRKTDNLWARSDIYIALVPTGTTATIVVTWPNSIDRCGLGVWACTGLSGLTAHQIVTDTLDPCNVSIDVPANGIAVGYMMTSGGVTTVWTNLTERFDAIVESADAHSGADGAFATTQTGLAVTADVSGTPPDAGPSLIVASWGPVVGSLPPYNPFRNRPLLVR